jgi:hypothetical protein
MTSEHLVLLIIGGSSAKQCHDRVKYIRTILRCLRYALCDFSNCWQLSCVDLAACISKSRFERLLHYQFVRFGVSFNYQ